MCKVDHQASCYIKILSETNLYSNMYEPQLGRGISRAGARVFRINTVQVVMAKIERVIGTTAFRWHNILESCNMITPALIEASHIPHVTILYHVYNAHIATYSTNTNFIYKRTMASSVHKGINHPRADLKQTTIIMIRPSITGCILACATPLYET